MSDIAVQVENLGKIGELQALQT